QDRDEEGGCLSGAGLGAGDHVAATECQRDHAALNRTRFGPAKIANARQQPLVEREFAEGDRCGIEGRRLVGQHRRLWPGNWLWVRSPARRAAAASTSW